MNPWDILGWILVIWLGSMIALKLLIIALDGYEKARRFLRRYIRHLRSRNTPPESGQRWYGSEILSYQITGVSDNSGRIGIRNGNVSWSDSPEEWRRRVRRSHLYLLER